MVSFLFIQFKFISKDQNVSKAHLQKIKRIYNSIQKETNSLKASSSSSSWEKGEIIPLWGAQENMSERSFASSDFTTAALLFQHTALFIQTCFMVNKGPILYYVRTYGWDGDFVDIFLQKRVNSSGHFQRVNSQQVQQTL